MDNEGPEISLIDQSGVFIVHDSLSRQYLSQNGRFVSSGTIVVHI